MLIANLNEQTKKVYVRQFESLGYSFLINESDLIIAKKDNTNGLYNTEEKIIANMVKRQIPSAKEGIIFIDLSKEFNLIINKVKANKKLNWATDNEISWLIRSAIIKAMVDKKKKQYGESENDE